MVLTPARCLGSIDLVLSADHPIRPGIFPAPQRRERRHALSNPLNAVQDLSRAPDGREPYRSPIPCSFPCYQGKRTGFERAETRGVMAPYLPLCGAAMGAAGTDCARASPRQADGFRAAPCKETTWPDCLASRRGLEPLTLGLGNRCSVLLS